MINKIRETIKKYAMINSGDTVTVGLSGGADSACLLYALNCLKDEFGFELRAAHINHGIRGSEADSDESFVRDMCQKLGVELTVFHKNIPLEAEKTGESEEECGRRIRYECFSSLSGKTATAHNLTDSVETTVFNLVRGSSVKGACGIPAVRDDIIRPLIDCTSKEIRSFCKDNGIPYVIDSTNLETEYTRNFIRHEILPRFERINPSYEQAISRFQSSAVVDNEYLESQAKAFIEAHADKYAIECELLKNLDKAILGRVLVKYIKSVSNADPEYRHIEFISDRLDKDFTLQLSSDLFVQVKDGRLSVKTADKAPHESFCFKLKEGLNETSMYNIEIAVVDRNKIKFNKKYTDNIFVCNIDYDKIKFADAVVRSRADGDEITLAKRGVTKSLKKLYNEMKIPVNLRNSVPVISDGEKVIWVFGAGYNKKCEITENTKRIMTIKAEERYA